MASDFSTRQLGSPLTAAVAQPPSRTAGDTVTTGQPAQVVDNRISLLSRQFRDQQFLRRRAYARALEQVRADSRALKVDRKI
jgi:hypothetical protein